MAFLKAPELQSCRWQIEPRLFSAENVAFVPVTLFYESAPSFDTDYQAPIRIDGDITLDSALDAMKRGTLSKTQTTLLSTTQLKGRDND